MGITVASQDEERQVEGSCLCGAVRFRVTLPSRFCCHCHCQNCRRAHGAAFVTWVGFMEEQVAFEAGEDELVRYRTDTDATRSFCGVCGTTLFYASPRWGGQLHVVRASLEGGIDRPPESHVYVDHGADWFEITDSIPRYGGKTGVEPK